MSSSFFCPDAQAFLRLLHTPDGLLAVRSLNPQAEWHFTSATLKEALPLLEKHSGSRALYACLNPVRADMGDGYAEDKDITSFRWFPIDADPVRLPDLASTDAEKAAAAAALDALLDALRAYLPGLDAALIRGDSGNGAHAIILLPGYPPHGDGKGRSAEWQKLKRLHTALCKKFSTAAVKFDTSVFNPSRIWRLYGTMNIKGEDTPERPHRMARLLSVPADLRPLDILAYEAALADAFAPTPPPPLLGAGGPPPLSGTGRVAEERGREGSPEPPDLPPWWTELVTPGDRNKITFQRARWLVNTTEGNRPVADAWDELRAWNKVVCRPPLPEDELRKTFDSARKAGDNPSYAAPPSDSPLPNLGEGGVRADGPGVRASGDAPWPAPLAAAAYHGLAGEIVRAVEPHTEADPAAVLVQLLVAVGSAIGREPFFLVGATRHHLNLFAVIVGDTAHARKGTSWDECRAILSMADMEWTARITGGLTSGEGLIQAVRDRVEKEVPKKDKDGKRSTETETVVTDEGVSDKRLLAVESEYASVLQAMQRDGNTLSATIRNAWDTGSLQNMTKEGRRATGAHISIIGHITAEELKRNLTSTEAANGFANRYLWLCARRARLLPEPTRPDVGLMAGLGERLRQAIDAARTVGAVCRDDDARRQWAAVYGRLTEATPGLLGSVTTRAAPLVTRLSLLYALLDKSPAVRTPHLMAALALWEYAEASCRYIFGDSLGDPVADDLLRRLRQAGAEGMTRTQISQAAGHHKDAQRIGRALALLLDNKRIRAERGETPGRPVETYFAL